LNANWTCSIYCLVWLLFLRSLLTVFKSLIFNITSYYYYYQFWIFKCQGSHKGEPVLGAPPIRYIHACTKIYTYIHANKNTETKNIATYKHTYTKVINYLQTQTHKISYNQNKNCFENLIHQTLVTPNIRPLQYLFK